MTLVLAEPGDFKVKDLRASRHSSCDAVLDEKENQASLEQALRLFGAKETLAKDDAWCGDAWMPLVPDCAGSVPSAGSHRRPASR